MTAGRPDQGRSSSSNRASEKAQRRAKVQAARLRIVIDSRLGRETPDWVKRLASDDR